jgi:hypothetical protein
MENDVIVIFQLEVKNKTQGQNDEDPTQHIPFLPLIALYFLFFPIEDLCTPRKPQDESLRMIDLPFSSASFRINLIHFYHLFFPKHWL